MTPGTYVLIIEIPRRMSFLVGALGKINVEKGILLYVGSALNGVEKRIARHFRREKKKHWHIDYITSQIQPKVAVFLKDKRKLEDAIAREFLSNPSLLPVPRFGASDSPLCTHLFWGRNYQETLSIVIRTLKKIGGKMPEMIFANHFSENR